MLAIAILLDSERLILLADAQRGLFYLTRHFFSINPLPYESRAVSKLRSARFTNGKKNHGLPINKSDFLQIDSHVALFLLEQLPERFQSLPLHPATQAKNHSTFSDDQPSDPVIHRGDKPEWRFTKCVVAALGGPL
jgi:hypothetical protein